MITIIFAPFLLFRGCRQGCALSPALFVLATEPLAEAIRISCNIKGFYIRSEIHKISLFADDILLVLTNPTYSLTHLQKLLHSYSQFSGYKVNFDKSEILPLSTVEYKTVSGKLPFKFPPAGFKYLGIYVDGDLQNLYKLNLLKALEKVGSDLAHWMDLPLTLLGRIHFIKINILPKFLYIFQSLPIHIPPTFCSSLNGLIRRVILRGKIPRLSLEKLTLEYNQCGLSY